MLLRWGKNGRRCLFSHGMSWLWRGHQSNMKEAWRETSWPRKTKKRSQNGRRSPEPNLQCDIGMKGGRRKKKKEYSLDWFFFIWTWKWKQAFINESERSYENSRRHEVLHPHIHSMDIGLTGRKAHTQERAENRTIETAYSNHQFSNNILQTV